MKVKRFFAPDMATAMRLVRDEVGPDAVILSNDRVAGGVEVVVGLDYPVDAPLRAPKPADDPQQRARQDRQMNVLTMGRNQAGARASGQGRVVPVRRGQDAELRADSRAAPARKASGLQSELARTRQALADRQIAVQDDERTAGSAPDPSPLRGGREPGVAAGSSRSTTTAGSSQSRASASAESAELRAMRDELDAMKAMMRERLAASPPQVAPPAASSPVKDPALALLQRRFERIGIVPALVRRLLQAIETGTDPDRAWKIALSRLSDALTTVGENIVDRGGILAFVGPTGVGKTTTIGKLAAEYVLKHGGSSIALVTTDSQRIAAHEQLRTFGRILDIPVRVVDEHNPLDEVLKGLRAKKVVLIDTAGMSTDSAEREAQLAMFAESSFRIKKFMVLPCTAQYQVMRSVCGFYKPLGLNGAILTKMDESASLGEAISLVIENRLPVAYLTDGQKIPDAIEVARANSLVSRAVVMAQRNSHADITDESLSDTPVPLFARSGDGF